MVHTPARLYGSLDAALGAPDTDWLARVGQKGWAVIGRDAKIYERPAELAAYLEARIQVFLLPGQARVAEMIGLVDCCLAAILRRHRAAEPWDLAHHSFWPCGS